MTDDESAAHLGRLIRASEVRVSAQIVTLLALAEAGFDTAEIEAALEHESEALTALRRQQLMINETREP
ncbi:MAG: hypothetical protein MIN69_13770 [Methylorubrum extorquens]|jgi:hypothetical protein|uniref:hypothetical protein n=1 Tax=Methylorubrum extorquens TaxID=408 RepID=UPI002FEDE91F